MSTRIFFAVTALCAGFAFVGASSAQSSTSPSRAEVKAETRALEKAGVHVVYGLLDLKTHSKVTLVVRQDADGIRCYAHIGTGNYHAITARLTGLLPNARRTVLDGCGHMGPVQSPAKVAPSVAEFATS